MVKTCRKCGIEKDVNEFKAINKKRLRFGPRATCKKCDYETAKSNPRKQNEYQKRYRVKIPEKVKEWDKRSKAKRSELIKKEGKKYRISNAEKIKSAHVDAWKKYRKHLHPLYVKSVLIQNGFPKNKITPELIEVKKIILKTKREIKKHENKD